jgi:hypothetical protein
MASTMDSCVYGQVASENGSRARIACTHGCDQGTCGNTTPHVNYLAGESHDIYATRHQGCPCRVLADGVCECSSNCIIYPELPTCFGEVFGEELPKLSSEEFDAAEADGVQRLTAEYLRLTHNEPSPTMSAAISKVVAAYVREHAPTRVQTVGIFDVRQLMCKVIRTWFHIKQEGNFLLGGRYDVSWTKEGNLRVEKISYKLVHEYTLCNDEALGLIMDELYSELPVLVPQLHDLLN